MTLSDTTTVADLVVERPGRARVFESFGIDYCCGGHKTLAEACHAKGIEIQTVLDAVDGADEEPEPDRIDWARVPVKALVENIVDVHHRYLRAELPRLTTLIDRVTEAHATNHPELTRVQEVFDRLRSELELHMVKEERVLFPACLTLEGPEEEKSPMAANIQFPVSAMVAEHRDAADGLEAIRTLTSDFSVSDDACNSYRSLLDSLHQLEQDLHLHIHKENNILFPRALQLAEGDPERKPERG